MPLVTSKRVWTQPPSTAVGVDRRYGLRRAIVIGTARNVDLVENIVVTTSDGSSIAPAIATSSGLGYLGNGNLYNSLISVPAWANTTNEASLCLVFEGRMATGWIAGTGSLTHFPFSNLLYCNTFWNGRWANGINLLSGDSWDGPHVIVITVKDGSQKIFHNGRLWHSAAATGGFTLPSTLSFFPRQSATIVSPVAAFAWDSYLPSDLAISYSSNPWQVIKKQDKRIWVPTAGGGATTISCTPGNATTAGIAAGISAATTIACTPGGASTAGVACALPIKIACNVGNVTTAGISCSLPVVVQCGVGTATTAGVSASISLDSSITITCNAGTATTSGIAASFPQALYCTPGNATTAGNSATFPQSLSCNVGNATTAGITAQVDIAGQIVIGCNAGTATTAGIQASVSSAIVLACSAGTATTLGATAYFPQSLQCSPGNAIAVGIDATFTVAGPTTIVCNVGNATASGISFSFGGTLVDAPNGSGPAIIIPRGTRGAVQNTTRPPNIGGIRI